MRKILALVLFVGAASTGCQSSASIDARPSKAIAVHLPSNGPGVSALIEHFESKNPEHKLEWIPAATSYDAEGPTVAFVQAGSGTIAFSLGKSEFGIGDLICMDAGESCEMDSPADLLVFTLPQHLGADLPQIIRPDWDENITDTPGGCATEGDAYRRILLTWQGKNGPYLSQQINAHRVRIHDSFTHYHPPVGGFDEFYLVQEAPPGARLLVSEKLDSLLDAENVDLNEASNLLREIPLHAGDLIYLPRGVVHRGVGGAVVQVITIPGFVPGAEIGVDRELQTINRRLSQAGGQQLPFHRGNEYVEVAEEPNEETSIRIGGKPFTTLRNDRRLPDLWPIRNAAGIPVTRTWPREGSVGEREDHPHHQSLWFAHGELSGFDFWHDPKLTVKQTSVSRTSGKSTGFVKSEHNWLDTEGQVICTDLCKITAFTKGDIRGIDFDLTLTAGKNGLRFGDTKEGTFAMRIASGLVADQGAELINDNGDSSKSVWGKAARWIQARGMVGGKPAAVVMAGHRENPRHPTHWHARNYGLLAANPFGPRAFTGQPNETGEMELAAGESLRLQYRVLVFARHPKRQEVENLLVGFTSESKP